MSKDTAPRAKTAYVVLQETKGRVGPGGEKADDTWAVVVATGVDAANAQDAIRQAAKGSEGVYVAVPARSWQPVTVKVETRTVVKLT